jgi:hypothetical protein
MYRYSVDNAITYASEDFVLFKESPFASWMERLTLENPDHGILPQAGSEAPIDTIESQDDLADTLRAEGKDVVLVNWERDEASRRTATVDAMRIGADFIVNAQLAVGPMSGSANLLMRTSGYSEFGDYLYVPCNTQRHANTHAALRLCLLADLLHSLQGQLPPQMLIIRGGSDLVALETEDHIYHYRAVKHRFMTAQQAFRKHKMPDPAESAHFGRWAECANEVLKQRALRGEETQTLELEPMELDEPSVDQSPALDHPVSAESTDEVSAQHIELDVEYEPQRVTASAGSYEVYTNLYSPTVAASTVPSSSALNSGTLVEQARMLSTSEKVSSVIGKDNDTLENLSFIGSSILAPTIGQKSRQATSGTSATSRPIASQPTANGPTTAAGKPAAPPEREPRLLDPSKAAPPPSLRNPEDVARGIVATPIPPTVDFEKLVYEKAIDTSPVMEKIHPLDSAGFQSPKESFVDLDSAAASVSSEEAPLPGLTDLPDLPELPDIAAAQKSAPEPVQPEVNLIEGSQMDDRAQYTEIFADSDDFLGRLKTNEFNSSLNTSDQSLLGKPETES